MTNRTRDVNHDEIVNAADIGLLVAARDDAPGNPMPPRDCPLAFIAETLVFNELSQSTFQTNVFKAATFLC